MAIVSPTLYGLLSQGSTYLQADEIIRSTRYLAVLPVIRLAAIPSVLDLSVWCVQTFQSPEGEPVHITLCASVSVQPPFSHMLG